MPATSLRERYPQVHASTRAEWRAWLAANHASAGGAWLVYHKKASGKPRVEYGDAVEEALCFGWIDSVMNPLDEHAYLQLFTPRKPKSAWSRTNKERVERLLAAGLIEPAGLRAIETAQANGSWNALDAVERLEPPPDLERAFARRKRARANFEAFAPSLRKQILYWLHNVKSTEKRTERITDIVASAGENLPPRVLRRESAPKKGKA